MLCAMANFVKLSTQLQCQTTRKNSHNYTTITDQNIYIIE
jgi:hypothetical protein